MVVEARSRKRFRVTGTVQGVGFRPFVYSLAVRLGLSGYVLNDSAGVLIEVEGGSEELERFGASLAGDPPPLAVIEKVAQETVATLGSSSFEIRKSEHVGESFSPISADVAVCRDCLDEMWDPTNRRYKYPFTNCTNCGPRFTITTDIPYDRPNTTMAAFSMCEACTAEYEDPDDRRFHAQPIACPRCGPHVQLVDPSGKPMDGEPIGRAAELIAAGHIVAVKGLGGFHLACDAANEDSVVALRRRKAREEKPFAVMARDLEAARSLAYIGEEAAAILTSRRRPITLMPRRKDAPIAASVAPGNRHLGVLLPYTPVHHLLLHELACPIVLTSGNLSDEPIAYQDAAALEHLGTLADAFLTNDRDIHVRCDDSVVRAAPEAVYPIRRARGLAPEPLTLAASFERVVLAAGPELKHTFCLGVGSRAILSHHIGDLENYEAMSAFLEALEHFTRVFDVRPEVVAHDLHPEYLSTKWATGLEGVERVGVQHHHAHIASCLADNDRRERVIGLALDGTGFGEDGAIWGGEVLACGLVSYERLAHLAYVPLPGGAAAIREPWRMAAVYLNRMYGPAASDLELDFVRRTRLRWKPILQMATTGINAPPTSSAGRLFDAAAALCGLRDNVSYEGQAAAELEQIADPAVKFGYPCSVKDGHIHAGELIAALAEDLVRGRPTAQAAAGFHNGLAAALVEACESARRQTDLSVVALSGGSFQNLLLLARTRSGLEEAGFEVLWHKRVPPNDGGVSLGQAVIAGARSASSAG